MHNHIRKNMFRANTFFIITFTILFYPAIFNITVLPQNNQKVCNIELKEYPGKDPCMWDGLYAASDGKVYSALITEGESGHFYVYDPQKGINTLLFDIADFLGERGKGIRSSGKLHNKPVEDNEGNIYFVSMNNGSGPRSFDYTSWKGGHWLKYDPKKDELTDLGLVDKGVGCYPLTIDKKRNYLFGIGFTGYFYRFDIKNRKTKNLGKVDSWDICRDIFCDDQGNVYGSFPVARVFKYDAEKEKVYNLPTQIPFDPTVFPTQLNNPMIDRASIWRAIQWDPVEKVAYGITGGSGSILFKLDPHTTPNVQITALTKMCADKYLDSNRKDIPYSTLAFALDSKNRKVYFVPSARDYNTGEYIETFGSMELAHLIMYDLETNTKTDLGAMKTKDGRRVFGCEAASVAPDGTVYICGQAEVKNKEEATRFIHDVPVALHLIIYNQK